MPTKNRVYLVFWNIKFTFGTSKAQEVILKTKSVSNEKLLKVYQMN